MLKAEIYCRHSSLARPIPNGYLWTVVCDIAFPIFSILKKVQSRDFRLYHVTTKISWIYVCPNWYVQIYEDLMNLCMSHLICSNLWRFDGSMYVPPNMSKSMKIWWSMDFSPNMFKSMKIWWIYGCTTWYVQIYEDLMDLWQICPSLCSNLWRFDGSMDVPPTEWRRCPRLKSIL